MNVHSLGSSLGDWRNSRCYSPSQRSVATTKGTWQWETSFSLPSVFLLYVGSNPINDSVLAPTNVQSQLSSAEMRVMKVNKKKADREEDGKEVLSSFKIDFSCICWFDSMSTCPTATDPLHLVPYLYYMTICPLCNLQPDKLSPFWEGICWPTMLLNFSGKSCMGLIWPRPEFGWIRHG